MAATVEDPEFISYLFSSKFSPDCFFLVGNKNHTTPERIGVAKAMLMAHSVVMRRLLEESKLAEKGVVAFPDAYPDTFRTLLRYVYGHDTTATLCFDEADNLLYMAEKYMMEALKKKLSTRLMSLLNSENICSLLNNPACYQQLELNSTITKILRYETDKVLASPLFLGLCPDGFVKILEQDGLNVPEIELWRAMTKWAKHNANSEDGKELRKQVSKLTKHTRICSLNGEQLCEEVVPTGILSDREVALVCLSIGKQEKQSGLTEICNEITPRGLLRREEKQQFEVYLSVESSIGHCDRSNFTIVTKNCEIELLPLECHAFYDCLANHSLPRGPTYLVSCTTTITLDTDGQNDTSTEPPITIRFDEQVEYGKMFTIPLISGGCNLTLRPNSKYTFDMKFGEVQKMFHVLPEEDSHFSLSVAPFGHDPTYYPVPMDVLNFKAAYNMGL